MILLIGGASHAGKTALAQKLLERLHYPYLSLDHLKMGLIRTGMTALTVEDDDAMRDFLWPIAAEIIKTAVENRQHLIVEGCYIPGNWRESFSAEYLAQIRCVFLVLGETYLRTRFDEVRRFASVIEQRLCDAPDAEELAAENRRILEECRLCGNPYIEVTERYEPAEILRKALEFMEK